MKKPSEPGNMPIQWKSIRSFANSYSADPLGFQKYLSSSTLWALPCQSDIQSSCASAVVAACTELFLKNHDNVIHRYHEFESKKMTRIHFTHETARTLTATQASFSAMRLPYCVWRVAFIAASSAAVGSLGTGTASVWETQAPVRIMIE